MKTKKPLLVLAIALFTLADFHQGMLGQYLQDNYPFIPEAAGIPSYGPVYSYPTWSQTDWSGGPTGDMCTDNTNWNKFESSENVDYSSSPGQLASASNVEGILASSPFDSNVSIYHYTYIGAANVAPLNLSNSSSYIEVKGSCGPWRPITRMIPNAGTYPFLTTDQFQYRVHLKGDGGKDETVLDDIQLHYKKLLSCNGCRAIQCPNRPLVTIEMLGNSTVNIVKDSTYEDAGAWSYEGADARCDITPTSDVDTSTSGTYHVTYSGVNSCGVTTEVQRTVNVFDAPDEDNQPPTITLNGNSNVTVDQGTVYTDAGATASDPDFTTPDNPSNPQAVDLTSSIVTINRVDTSTLGTYRVTYNVSDAWGVPAQEVYRTVEVVEPGSGNGNTNNANDNTNGTNQNSSNGGTWTQTDWSGGSGQVNWNNNTMYDTGTNIDGSTSPGDLQLSPANNNIVYTTDTDFNGGTYTQTVVSGTGEPAYVGLAPDSGGMKLMEAEKSTSTGSGSVLSLATDLAETLLTPLFAATTYYTSGTYVSSLIDISSKGLPSLFSRQVQAPNKGQDITFEIRTWSDQNTPDYDWDSTSCFLNKSGLSPCMNSGSPYLQFRANFIGGTGTTEYPIIEQVTLQYPTDSAYNSTGVLTSSIFDSGDPTTVWGPLAYTIETPAQTDMTFEYSNDGGASWHSMQSGDMLGQSQTLRYRVTLQSLDGTATPVFHDITIPYEAGPPINSNQNNGNTNGGNSNTNSENDNTNDNTNGSASDYSDYIKLFYPYNHQLGPDSKVVIKYQPHKDDPPCYTCLMKKPVRIKVFVLGKGSMDYSQYNTPEGLYNVYPGDYVVFDLPPWDDKVHMNMVGYPNPASLRFVIEAQNMDPLNVPSDGTTFEPDPIGRLQSCFDDPPPPTVTAVTVDYQQSSLSTGPNVYVYPYVNITYTSDGVGSISKFYIYRRSADTQDNLNAQTFTFLPYELIEAGGDTGETVQEGFYDTDAPLNQYIQYQVFERINDLICSHSTTDSNVIYHNPYPENPGMYLEDLGNMTFSTMYKAFDHENGQISFGLVPHSTFMARTTNAIQSLVTGNAITPCNTGGTTAFVTFPTTNNQTITWSPTHVPSGNYDVCVQAQDSYGNRISNVGGATIDVPEEQPVGGGGVLPPQFPDQYGILQQPNTPSEQPSEEPSIPNDMHASAPIAGTSLGDEFAPVYFTDIANHWGKQYIDTLHERCNITGYTDEDGNPLHLFGPDDPISRAELVKILLQCQKIDGVKTDKKPFPDVDLNTWYAPYLTEGKNREWIEGYKDHTFKPLQIANQAEALKMILLSEISRENLQVDSISDLFQGTWFQKYMLYSITQKYINENDDPSQPMTRVDIAKLIYLIKGWGK